MNFLRKITESVITQELVLSLVKRWFNKNKPNVDFDNFIKIKDLFEELQNATREFESYNSNKHAYINKYYKLANDARKELTDNSIEITESILYSATYREMEKAIELEIINYIKTIKNQWIIK